MGLHSGNSRVSRRGSDDRNEQRRKEGEKLMARSLCRMSSTLVGPNREVAILER